MAGGRHARDRPFLRNNPFVQENQRIDENWKDIPDTDYSVSDLGRVASRKRGGFRIMSPARNRKGYLHVPFSGGGHCTQPTVHHLVATAFLGERPTERHQVNHKDGDKANNTPGNLEWVTVRQNARHRVDVLGKTNPSGDDCQNSKLTSIEVREIKRRLADGEQQKDIAAGYGVSPGTVSCIAHGRTWRDVV